MNPTSNSASVTATRRLGSKVTFFQHGCERVNIEAVVNGKIEEYGFDAPRMIHVETQQQATSPRVGGPEKGVSHKRPGAVRR